MGDLLGGLVLATFFVVSIVAYRRNPRVAGRGAARLLGWLLFAVGVLLVLLAGNFWLQTGVPPWFAPFCGGTILIASARSLPPPTSDRGSKP